MTTQTVKCPICGEPYKVYTHTTADQTACGNCVKKAEEKEGNKIVAPQWIIDHNREYGYE